MIKKKQPTEEEYKELYKEAGEFGLKAGKKLAEESKKTGKSYTETEVRALVGAQWIEHLIDTGREQLVPPFQLQALKEFRVQEKNMADAELQHALRHMSKGPKRLN